MPGSVSVNNRKYGSFPYCDSNGGCVVSNTLDYHSHYGDLFGAYWTSNSDGTAFTGFEEDQTIVFRVVPDPTIMSMVLFLSIESNVDALAIMYQLPDVSGGTEVEPFNNNGHYPTAAFAPTCKIYHDPTVTDIGTVIAPTLMFGGSGSIPMNSEYSIGKGEYGAILPSGLEFTVTCENTGGRDGGLAVRFNWYEVDKNVFIDQGGIDPSAI